MSIHRRGSSELPEPRAPRGGAPRARRIAPWLGSVLGTAGMLWAASASGAEVTFAWDPVVDAEGYRLYYDIDDIDPPYDGDQGDEDSPVDVPVAGLADPNAPEVTLTGLPSCTHFYFAITAYNQAGESDYGVPIEATIVGAPDPVTVSPDASGSLRVAWGGLDDSGSIPGYRIHYDLDSGEPYEGAGSPVNVQTSSLSDPANPSYLLAGLTNGTTYYVAVESRCDDDSGNLSEEAEGVPTEGGTGGTGTGGTGTGGTGTGGTGTAASGGAGASSAAAPGDADEDGSCGCRTVGATGSPARWLLVPAVVLLATRRRRRPR